jgi:hypothetical protein
VFGAIRAAFSRRRVLVVAPFALGGLAVALSRVVRSPTASENVEIAIIKFDDAGRNLGPAIPQKVVRSDGDWRRRLTNAQYWSTRRGSTDSLLPARITNWKPRACSAVSAVETRCSVHQPNSIPAPAGPVSAPLSRPRTYALRPITAFQWNAWKSCAAYAMRTWAMCLTTVLRPRVCATASMSRLCDSFNNRAYSPMRV